MASSLQHAEVTTGSRTADSASSIRPAVGEPAEATTDYAPWLHHAENAGVSKQRKKSKPLTRQQRMRQQKGIEKADAITGKLEKKVQDSRTRGKRLQARRIEWEDLNGVLEGKSLTKDRKGRKAVLARGEDKTKDDLKVDMGDTDDRGPTEAFELTNEGKMELDQPLVAGAEVDEVT